MSLPGAKRKRGMANPPILTTDMGQVKGGGVLGRNHIKGAVRIPNGFLDSRYAKGVAAMWQREIGTNSFDDEFNDYGLAVHAPNEDVTAYAQGWRNVEGSVEGNVQNGVMGAQRRGQYVYGITSSYYTSQGGATYQYVDRFHGIYGAERRHHDKAHGYEGFGGAAAGQPEPSFRISRNTEIFVSDHAPPRFWYLNETTCGYLLDDDTCWAWHYRANDNRAFGSDSQAPFYGRQAFKFQYWHYYQNYKKPSKKWLDPTLVHPWRSGDYGPPEMWWFKPEVTSTGEYTQRVKIYRSEWRPGQYRDDRGWLTLAPRYVAHETTPDGMVGEIVPGTVSLDDTSTNVDGLAFEHDFHDEEHYVGTVGPFRGAMFANRGEDSMFGDGRTIKVIRDPRRRNRLILGMFQPGSIFGQGWDGAWFAVSPDDGKRWGRTRQMNPFAQTKNGMAVDSFQALPSMLMTTGGDLLVPAAASFNDKPLHSFAVVNFSAAVSNRPEQERTVWRRGAGGDQ